ncbi:NAD(P)-binding protein [Ceratobasidium sp. AG-I]|nr:NAD(P)-binding protein [Ceratobasidium sp. AG-I]
MHHSSHPAPEVSVAIGQAAAPQLEKQPIHLSAVRSKQQESSPSDTLDAIKAMIEKYAYKLSDRNVFPGTRRETQKERVVVTGTTGALGAYLLAILLESDAVEVVWTLNRKSKEGILARQKAAFDDKLLDVGLLDCGTLVMLEADLEDEKLGLEASVYQEIQTGATAIIHNAWPVHFNFNLQSFEPNIRGTRNLLDLAFASPNPPRFLYISSIAAAGFGDPGRPLEEDYLNPEDATAGIGYGQSKLVTEMILRSARSAGLETCVVRPGQLVGDDKSGAWSPTDWIPAFITSSVSVGCLPAATGNVTWLPLDIAARSVVDTCIARVPLLPPVINTSHPRPVSWVHMMRILRDVLKSRGVTSQLLSIVSFREWNERVISAAAASKGSRRDISNRFPSIKIQKWIKKFIHADEAARYEGRMDVEAGIGTARMDMSHATELSESLRNATRLEREHVEKWVEYWEKESMFVPSGFHLRVGPTHGGRNPPVSLARL